MSKHTPTPWYYDGEDIDSEAAASWDGNGYEIFSKDEDGNVTNGIAGGIPEEANAAHIVLCVNMHEELIQMIEEFLSYLKYEETDNINFSGEYLIKKVTAILAKAKS